MNLRKKEVWTTKVENVSIEIVHWGSGELNQGRGIWNYYIVLSEHLMGEQFESFWLEDELIRFSKDSPEHVTHSYNHLLPEIEFHGGITYYEKMGHTKRHRLVKIGCDFNHLWDVERGWGYTLDEVAWEAEKTAQQINALPIWKNLEHSVPKADTP